MSVGFIDSSARTRVALPSKPCANKRRPVFLRGPAYGSPNPARILVEASSKFYRYIRHNSDLRGANVTGVAALPQSSMQYCEDDGRQLPLLG